MGGGEKPIYIHSTRHWCYDRWVYKLTSQPSWLTASTLTLDCYGPHILGQQHPGCLLHLSWKHRSGFWPSWLLMLPGWASYCGWRITHNMIQDWATFLEPPVYSSLAESLRSNSSRGPVDRQCWVRADRGRSIALFTNWRKWTILLLFDHALLHRGRLLGSPSGNI